MRQLCCLYCGAQWEAVTVKKEYFSQNTVDCIKCQDCQKPNFLITKGENKKIFDEEIRKVVLSRLSRWGFWYLISLTLFIAYIIRLGGGIQDGIFLWLLFSMIFGLPLFWNPFSKRVWISLRERKELMWTYGTLSKSTFEDK